MTEGVRARRQEQMKARYVVHGSGPPTTAPSDLHERLGRAILRTLATDPALFAELLRP